MGNSATAFAFESVDGVGPTLDFAAFLENRLDELFGNGAAANLIEAFDLGNELAVASVEFGAGSGFQMK